MFAVGCWLLAASGLAQGPRRLPGYLLNDAAERGMVERRTAMHKGDTLLIRVNEVMKGQFKANTSTNKTVSATANKINLPIIDVFAGPVLGHILGGSADLPRKIVNGILGGGTTGGSESSTGGGTADNSSQFTTTISVKVVDVEPNGNLRIAGTRLVRVNKELQKMTLTGIVRPDDVLADNTVSSDRIADANIEADGKGAVAAKTRQGLINKILDWLF